MSDQDREVEHRAFITNVGIFACHDFPHFVLRLPAKAAVKNIFVFLSWHVALH